MSRTDRRPATDRDRSAGAAAGRPRRRLALAGGLGVLLLIAAGLALRAPWAARRQADAARRALAEGRLDSARAAVERLLRDRPDSAEGHFLRARVAFASGRLRQVDPELDRALVLGHPAREVDRLRAFALVLAGQYAPAEPILTKLAATDDGPDPEIDEALARIYLQSYRLGPAEAVLKRWAKEAPSDPRPYLWLTEIDRRDASGPVGAVEHYRTALRLDPNLDRARFGLAEVLRELHRYREAAPEYDAYLARHPDDPAAHLGAGRNALERGELDAGAAHLDRALSLDPNLADALRARAEIAQRQDQPAEALAWLDRALARDPFDPDAHYARSRALARLGRADESRQARERSAQLRDDQARLLALREQLNQAPKDDGLRCAIARWMLDHGQADEAARWARNVLSARPDHPEANRLLAEVHDLRGESGLANFYRMKADERH